MRVWWPEDRVNGSLDSFQKVHSGHIVDDRQAPCILPTLMRTCYGTYPVLRGDL